MPLKKRPAYQPVEEDESSDGGEDELSDVVEDQSDGFSADEKEDDGEDEIDDTEEIPLEPTMAAPLSAQRKEPPKKKPKKVKQPPNSREINAMRETQNLYHSNLFKLQASEMLAEIKIKPQKAARIAEWIQQLEAAVAKIPKSKATSITDTAWLKDLGVECPSVGAAKPSWKAKKFAYFRPRSIRPVGSLACGLLARSSDTVTADLLVEMPAECLERDDNVDQVYQRKRALYLSYLAGQLVRLASDVVAGAFFEWAGPDSSRSVALVLEPRGRLERRVRFRLLAAPPEEFFRPPEVGEADGLWADQLMAAVNRDAAAQLAPLANVADALLLGRVWLRQRQLDDAFGFFVLTQFVLHLVDTKKILPTMSHFQVLRTTWLHLSRSDWTKCGISRVSSGTSASAHVADWHGRSDVVFADASGRVNYCAGATVGAYEWLRWEANLAVALLNHHRQSASTSFGWLFMRPKPFLLAFDAVIVVNDRQSSAGVEPALRRGLGPRLRLLAAKPRPPQTWALDAPVPERTSCGTTLGLMLRPPAAWDPLDKGPAADSDECAEFRSFWGDKSQLRRFQDGYVCEAVHWPAANWSERRQIVRRVVDHVLQRHLQWPADGYHYAGHQLETVLSVARLDDSLAYATGEEALQRAVDTADELTKQLRRLEGLPLVVTQVQGVAPALRHCEPFAPLASLPQGSQALMKRRAGVATPTADMTPLHAPSLRLLVTLETSGKWPDDLDAVRRVKAAFHVQLADALARQCATVAKASADDVLVLYSGFVFRLVIAYGREVGLLKRSVENGLVKFQDTPQSLELECQTSLLPRLSAALRGLQAQQPAFGASVRMAKRWLACQMLLDYVGDEVVELLVASLFVDSASYGQVVDHAHLNDGKTVVDWTGPTNPQVAFLRFLQLVAVHDWRHQPLAVSLNGELDADAVRRAEAKLSDADQQPQLPTLVLPTPYDAAGVALTRHRPTAGVWQRVVLLAAESLKLLQRQLLHNDGSDLLQSFRPPLDGFDVLIHLKRGLVARRLLALDAHNVDKKVRPMASDPKKAKTVSLPVVDYDPAELLVRELRALHGDRARFFHDPFGGIVVGVSWIDKAWRSQEFKVSSVAGCSVDASAEDRLATNVEAVCQDFLIVGHGLIDSVQTKSFVWQGNV